jgi:hypothetical protein
LENAKKNKIINCVLEDLQVLVLERVYAL